MSFHSAQKEVAVPIKYHYKNKALTSARDCVNLETTEEKYICLTDTISTYLIKKSGIVIMFNTKVFRTEYSAEHWRVSSRF